MEENLSITPDAIKTYTFEEKYKEIETIVNKRKLKWTNSKITHIPWEDVRQEILVHIFTKWSQWDQTKGNLGNYLNRIITNQIINKIKKHYGVWKSPCKNVNCALKNKQGHFKDVQEQHEDKPCGKDSEKICSECPVYKKWFAKRNEGFLMKNPISMNSEDFEVSYSDAMPSHPPNSEQSLLNLNEAMRDSLSKEYWEAYDLLFIQCIGDEKFAEIRKYISTENRKAGYKRIAEIKKYLLGVARAIIAREQVVVW